MAAQDRPNVLLIITDDQGYGDVGFMGNPHVKTPTIDQLAKENILFNQFYVSPVCAPTRSSLLTGRYSLRTGVRDTYNGGATMATEEITLAEILQQAGYRTGLFGKWHLGDNYPNRPSDQGFHHSLMHRGGGMGQPGDLTTFFQGDSSYFNPILWENNQQKKFDGYCSDIFTDEAIKFIAQNKNQPFFCYLSFNAPHTPLQVPQKYYDQYKDIDPSKGFPSTFDGPQQMTEKDKEDARKVYAMVTNIDDNIQKILIQLEELNIADNTILIFMTDNGPQQMRYKVGRNKRKGSVFNGGVQVPFILKLPNQDTPKSIDVPVAHIDVLPSLAELCGATLPTDRIIDGMSFVPLLDDRNLHPFENRSLFFYWTRKYPERYKNMAYYKAGYKLIAHTDYDASLDQFQLFNIHNDASEKRNLSSQNPQKVAELKSEMDKMYESLVYSDHLLNSPRAIVGHPNENPIILSRNDTDGERGVWTQEEIFGFWKVAIEKGTYDITFKFIKPLKESGEMILELNSLIFTKHHSISSENQIIEWKNVSLPKMEADLIPFFRQKGNKQILPFTVELKKVSP